MTTTPPPSNIELAKALHHLKRVSNPEQFASIMKMLAGGPVPAINAALAGLSQEDEFVLLCLLIQTSTHLAPIDQTAAVAAGKSAPDLLARFQPGLALNEIPSSRHGGYRCMVEVKSTSKPAFSMGGKALQRLRSFADAFDLPLVFAVRFLKGEASSLWVIVGDTDRTKRTLNISTKDWIPGLRAVLWNEYAYTIVPGTIFQVDYSRSVSGDNVRHTKYGEQVAFRTITSTRTNEFTAGESVLVSGFLEAYSLRETKVEENEDLIRVTYEPESISLSIADLIYRINNLPRNDEGNLLYDASRAMRELAEHQATALVNRELVEMIGTALYHIGVLTIGSYGEPEELYRKWVATGGEET